MPFKIKEFQIEEEISLENIAGAYYRIHRINQNISLSFLANKIHMNKGFLSELENGKRHFPAGVTKQLNEALNICFDDNKQLYDQARNYLIKIFDNFFLERDQMINTIYENFNEVEEEIKTSYGFFVYLIIKLFYCLRLKRNDEKVFRIKEILDTNLRCLQKDEQAIYYSLLGIFYKRKTVTNEYALNCFFKSNSICISGSVTNAMNSFQLISVYSELNQPIIAYRACIECRNLLQIHHNYNRLVALDLFESAVLINLRLFNEAKEKLLKILSSTDDKFLNKYTDRIYHSLAWNALLSENYEECIHYTKEAKIKNDLSPDLCYFIPFSLFKLNRFSEALNECNKEKKGNTDFYIPFLESIKARIKGEKEEFENNILIYYKQLLLNRIYEDIPFVQRYILDFYEETNETDLKIKTYKEMFLYYENKLNEKTSFLLI